MADLFADAVRAKVRFDTVRGCLSVEDLWDLPLTSPRGLSLDTLARTLYRELQETKEASFVDDPPPANTVAQLRFDLVKYIIDVKKAERQVAVMEAERAARKARLLKVLAHKQDAALEQHSIEELESMIAAL